MASLNESSYAKCLIYKLTQEIVHVATIDNVHLNVDEVFEYLVDLNEKVGAHYPSMYQDLIVNNRKLKLIILMTQLQHWVNNVILKRQSIALLLI